MNLGSIAQYQDDRVEMMEAMKLSPFSTTDSQNNGAIVFVDKHNATKLKEIAHKLHNVEEIAPPSPPNHLSPRRYIGNPCFDKILQSSRYKAVKDIEWREFDNDISASFNVSWERKKAMRVAIPALFSGALLVEDHQLLYITCVEAYCKCSHIDVHCEHYVGAESTQSDPGKVNNKHDSYNGVCIKAAHEYNTAHIRIGLQTSNLLVVGSIRVDVEDSASLGIANNIFKPTKYTRLFFDPRSIQKAEQLVKDNIAEIQGAYDYARLRQLRSKFDEESTYYMCRAAADGFLAHQNWPITIWTYANVETKSGKASSTKIASSLFIKVATCVFEQKLLSRETVEQIHDRMETAASNIKKESFKEYLSYLVKRPKCL
ncbi:hypothetical protein BDF22DRAFT_743829 [Syncephalis plumigaleata]|nr:hypothetical protein BDF22DRAFT_743829 [Syncephalis plumigaleata]